MWKRVFDGQADWKYVLAALAAVSVVAWTYFQSAWPSKTRFHIEPDST